MSVFRQIFATLALCLSSVNLEVLCLGKYIAYGLTKQEQVNDMFVEAKQIILKNDGV